MTTVDQRHERPLTVSERGWLATRRRLVEHRFELGRAAVDAYPSTSTVAGSPLLTDPRLMPAGPIPLDDVDLGWLPDTPFDGVTGTEPVADSVVPAGAHGVRYRSYSSAMAELAAPAVFDNRRTYRLVDADLSGSRGRLVFGRGRYFDSIDTGEACAHEYADQRWGPLRAAIGDPCNPAHRPMNLAISTLTLRSDAVAGQASFPLHWRDPAQVGHAGGLFQVIPVGVFQPSGDQPWHELPDFSLWRAIVRECAEELLGEPERHDGRAPIDYDGWSFAAQLTDARRHGQVRVYCLGLGVDPLTLATDLLTCVVIDAAVFDELFAGMVTTNVEGHVDGADAFHPFTATAIEQLTHAEPMQAAGAALLELAIASRHTLLG